MRWLGNKARGCSGCVRVCVRFHAHMVVHNEHAMMRSNGKKGFEIALCLRGCVIKLVFFFFFGKWLGVYMCNEVVLAV